MGGGRTACTACLVAWHRRANSCSEIHPDHPHALLDAACRATTTTTNHHPIQGCAYGDKCRYDHVRPDYTRQQQQQAAGAAGGAGGAAAAAAGLGAGLARGPLAAAPAAAAGGSGGADDGGGGGGEATPSAAAAAAASCLPDSLEDDDAGTPAAAAAYHRLLPSGADELGMIESSVRPPGLGGALLGEAGADWAGLGRTGACSGCSCLCCIPRPHSNNAPRKPHNAPHN